MISIHEQVKYVDCYTVTIKELESVTSKYRFESMMRGMGLFIFFTLALKIA